MQNYRNGVAIIEDIIFDFDDMNLFAENRTQTVGNGYHPFRENQRSDVAFLLFTLHFHRQIYNGTHGMPERMVCVPYNL